MTTVWIAIEIGVIALVTGCGGGEWVSVNGEPRLPPGGFIEHCNRNPTAPECSR